MLCILEEGLFGVHTRNLIFTLQNVMTNPKNFCMDFEVFYLHQVLRLCFDALPLLFLKNVRVMMVGNGMYKLKWPNVEWRS